MHDSCVIHLDIKPSNVFVTRDGRFRLGDFGMASLWPRPSGSPDGNENPASFVSESGSEGLPAARDDHAKCTLSRGGFEREGDRHYLAPEVLQGQYGKAADVFR